ncbi:MAG TPA: hemerythrin domain-containing protein [Streptosporangiaceae bacterium]
MDITQLILDDHHEQRRLFAILEQIDPADTGSLAQVWARLSTFLEVHAQAEEEIFYPELLRLAIGPRHLASAEPETLDAIHDHNDIRDAIAEVAPHPVGSAEWLAAIAAVNLANGDHMAEEEREGLTDFRRSVALQRRHELAVAFAVFESRHFSGVRPVDKDPAEYVAEAERAAEADGTADASVAAAQPGSLGIGSLR